jgi:hypothetical protein
VIVFKIAGNRYKVEDKEKIRNLFTSSLNTVIVVLLKQLHNQLTQFIQQFTRFGD